MGKKFQERALAAVLSSIVMAILLSACGGSSSSSTPESTTGGVPPSKSSAKPPSIGEQQGATSFIKPQSPNNKYVKFGKEASSAELSAASEVLAENLEAREAADFATQCETLSTQANEEIAEVTNPTEARSRCPKALEKLATPLKNTEEFRVDNFGGQLAVLRVEGNTGYAFYHGNDKKDWMMPMVKEGSTWKASSITTTEV